MSRVIAGFPLTNASYVEPVSLLKQRFGNPQKIVNAHMQALLDLPCPVNELSSLQYCYDSMESHIRGLAATGISEDSHDALLIPVVLGKLPMEICRNIARENNNLDWIVNTLREAILKELRILEAGLHVSSSLEAQNSPTITASFFTGTGTQRQGSTQNVGKILPAQGKRNFSCIYCKGNHTSFDCELVTDPRKRLDIVKSRNACNNCLGNHRAVQCPSKFRCRICNRKHHLSLHQSFQTAAEKTADVVSDPAEKTEHKPPPEQTVHASALNTHAEGGTTCILKTAIATVAGSDTSVTISDI